MRMELPLQTLLIPTAPNTATPCRSCRGWLLYAEAYGSVYRRIVAVAEVKGKLRVLNIMDPAVRNKIAGAKDAKSLYEGTLANDY